MVVFQPFCSDCSTLKTIVSYSKSGVLFVADRIANIFAAASSWAEGDVSVQAFRVSLCSLL